MDFTISIPEQAKQILETIQKAGHEAYLVGGCVRDTLLGRTPNDYDITTSAMPEEVKALFDRTIDTGIKHGTVTVLLGGKDFEVTTFRIDGKYADNRHPESVTFTRSLREDLLRRDFTVNAFAYSPQTGLIDCFDGLRDLKEGVIRAVGDPDKRFEEDALRILRAVRFSAQLGFGIEPGTRKACQRQAWRLENVSMERIRDELLKMILSPHPEILMTCHDLGLTPYFLPEFDTMVNTKQETPFHCYDVAWHTIKAMEHARKDRILQLTLLFHDSGKPAAKFFDEKGIAHFYQHEKESARIAQEAMKRLKFPNKLIEEVVFLVLHHGDVFPATEKSIRREIGKVGLERFPLLMEIQRADVSAQSEMARQDHERRLDDVERVFSEERKKADCFSLKDLAVHGTDLIEAGMKPGPEIGRILDNMLKYVVDNPDRNNKDFLLGNLRLFQ